VSVGVEEPEEAIGGDDRRPGVHERVELEGGVREEAPVEDDADPAVRVVDDGEGGDGAGGDAEPLAEPLRAREGEAARAEGLGERPEVERPVLGEDDEPGRASPLLEEEVLAVTSCGMRRRDLRLGDGEDGIVIERPCLDAELGEPGEEARRIVRAGDGFVGSHRRDSEPGGHAGV